MSQKVKMVKWPTKRLLEFRISITKMRSKDHKIQYSISQQCKTNIEQSKSKEALDKERTRRAPSLDLSLINILIADRAKISSISPIRRLNLPHLGKHFPKWAYHTTNHVLHSSSCRAMNRLERADSTFTLQPFFSMPRSRVF